MAYLDVLYDILEEGTGFVGRYKTSRHEVKAFLFDQSGEVGSDFRGLLLPPHLEELDLCMIEGSFLVLHKGLVNAV